MMLYVGRLPLTTSGIGTTMFGIYVAVCQIAHLVPSVGLTMSNSVKDVEDAMSANLLHKGTDMLGLTSVCGRGTYKTIWHHKRIAALYVSANPGHELCPYCWDADDK